MSNIAVDDATFSPGQRAAPHAALTVDREHLSGWRLLAYGLPNFPIQATLAPISLLLAPFFTGELGVTLTTWALIAGLARIVDITTDPIVGIVCDRLPSRWGRRRHWLVLMAPLVMIGCALLFTPQYVTEKPTFWYVMVAMLLFNFAATVQGLNHTAWGGELSTNYSERTRIMGWRAGVGAIARFLAFGIPAAMEWITPSATTGDKLEVLMWAIVVLVPLTTLIAVTCVGERAVDELPEEERHSLSFREVWFTLKLMFTNKYLGWVLLVDVLKEGPTAVKAALFVFYVSYMMKEPGLSSTLLLLVFAASVFTTPLWMKLAKGREKHKLLAIAVLIYGCSQASMLFWGPGELFFFTCAIVVNGAMNAGPAFLMQSMMADVVDYDTAKSGRQQTGTYFAVLETTAKLAPALALMAIFPLLQAAGFDPTGKANTPEALDAVRYTFALAPTIPVLLAAWLLWKFPLGSKEQAELRAQIEVRKANQAAARA